MGFALLSLGNTRIKGKRWGRRKREGKKTRGEGRAGEFPLLPPPPPTLYTPATQAVLCHATRLA